MATVKFYKKTGVSSARIQAQGEDGTLYTGLVSTNPSAELENIDLTKGFYISRYRASKGYESDYFTLKDSGGYEYSDIAEVDEIFDFFASGNQSIYIYGNPINYTVTFKKLGDGLKSGVIAYEDDEINLTTQSSETYSNVWVSESLAVIFDKNDFDLDNYYATPIIASLTDSIEGDWESENFDESIWLWDCYSGSVTFSATNYNPGTPTLKITSQSQNEITFSSESISEHFSGINPIYLKEGTTVIDETVIYRTSDGTSTGSFSGLSLNALVPYKIEATFVHEKNNEFNVNWDKTIETTAILVPQLEMNWDNDDTTEDTIATATSAILTIHTPAGIGDATYSVSIKEKNASSSTSVEKDKEIGSNISDTTTIPIPNLTHNTAYTITVKYKLSNGQTVSDEISFTTLNAYTIKAELNNLNHIYIETEGMDSVYVANKGTFLVIPGETFTVSFPKNNKTGTSAFTAYTQTHDEGKEATYSWPYGFPIEVEGIKQEETSRIFGNPGEASYLVGTADTENGKTYTFTAYPSGWAGWTDSEKPKAKEKTTTFSVESWNKLVNCLDAWNAFCGQSEVKGTFMPQSGSYNFTATIYNKIYDELTGLFNISSSYPIMNRVEIGKERQTPVSASGLINIGNNIKYDYLKSNYK